VTLENNVLRLISGLHLLVAPRDHFPHSESLLVQLVFLDIHVLIQHKLYKYLVLMDNTKIQLQALVSTVLQVNYVMTQLL